MADGAGKPKPAFFIAVIAVVIGLCGLAFYRCNSKKAGDGKATGSGSDYIDPNLVKKNGSGTTAENPDPNAPATTVTEYKFEPSTTLPAVPGTSDYEKLGKPRVVQ